MTDDGLLKGRSGPLRFALDVGGFRRHSSSGAAAPRGRCQRRSKTARRRCILLGCAHSGRIRTGSRSRRVQRSSRPRLDQWFDRQSGLRCRRFGELPKVSALGRRLPQRGPGSPGADQIGPAGVRPPLATPLRVERRTGRFWAQVSRLGCQRLPGGTKIRPRTGLRGAATTTSELAGAAPQPAPTTGWTCPLRSLPRQPGFVRGRGQLCWHQ